MCVCVCSEGQSAAIPVASMEFTAICLRNALLLLPEHQQHESKQDNGSKSSSQSGSTESGSENSDACRCAHLQNVLTYHPYPELFTYFNRTVYRQMKIDFSINYIFYCRAVKKKKKKKN